MHLIIDDLKEASNLVETYISENVVGAQDKFDEAVKYSTIPTGKCLRSFLLLSISKILKLPLEQSLAMATSIELIHSYSLTHDDLPALDNGMYRRNKLCCHRRFSESTAILVGNYLISSAFTILAKANIQLPILQLLAEALGILIRGQYMDLNYDYHHIDSNQAMEIYRCKTAELFRISCVFPFLQSKSSSSLIKHASIYGTQIGLAFQMLDDLEDVEIPSCFTEQNMHEMVDLMLHEASSAANKIQKNNPKLRLLEEYLREKNHRS